MLHHITIAEGGALHVGERPCKLPPQPEAIRQALASYLDTLLERYQFLTLQGLGVGSSQQVSIALRAVFINVRTNVQISDVAERLREVLLGRAAHR